MKFFFNIFRRHRRVCLQHGARGQQASTERRRNRRTAARVAVWSLLRRPEASLPPSGVSTVNSGGERGVAEMSGGLVVSLRSVTHFLG